MKLFLLLFVGSIALAALTALGQVRVEGQPASSAEAAMITRAGENYVNGWRRAEDSLTTTAIDQTQLPMKDGLQGVWKVTEQWSRVTRGDWTRATTPYLSLYIFTEKHYSYMFTLGLAPRRLFAGDPNKPTDAEKAGAYSSFVAATGAYVLSGPTLILSATIMKNPNEMAGPPLAYSVNIDGNTLRMTIVNPPWAPGHEDRRILTRVE